MEACTEKLAQFKKPRFFIETYGCQMNQYDSLIARNILEKGQGKAVNTAEEADLILLNTCAIRENAHEKIYNRLRSLEHLHKRGIRIGILGCMAQNLKEDLLYEELPLDFVIGPDALRNLPSYLNKPTLKEKIKKQAHLNLSKTETYDDLIPNVEHHFNSENNKVAAFVSIQRGCNNFCTFCVVPYTRGRERSRDPNKIIDEIQHLNEYGIKSVILLGQNVNSYNYQNYNFTHLVEAILKKTNLPRLSFTSPHPKDFPTDLIKLMAMEDRFVSQAHIPLQSGNSEILKKMRRNYTPTDFLNLIEKFKTSVPNVNITTDIIVGFPGETESQYLDTLKIMELADFDSAFMFAYSERRGTIAQKRFSDDVSKEDKSRRLAHMIELQLQRSLRHNEKMIGKKLKVLVEGHSRRSENQLQGRILNGKKVILPIPNPTLGWKYYIGKVLTTTIQNATPTTLLA